MDSNSSNVHDLMNNLTAMCCLHTFKTDVVTTVLKRLTVLTKLERHRQAFTSSNWDTLIEVAELASSLLQKQNLVPEQLNFIAELLRCLRNSCIGSCGEEYCAVSFNELFDVALKILLQLMKNRQNETEEEVVALRCCLQLFGNLICQSNTFKSIVWNSFNKEAIFRCLLKHKDLKVQEYSMMILYNCLTPESQRHIINTTEGQELFAILTDALCLNFVDWGILLMEFVVNDALFMENCYNILPIKNRLLVLDVIAELLDGVQTSCSVPKATLKHINHLFTEYAMDIVKVCNSDNSDTIDLKPIEIVKLLSLLCSASVVDELSLMLKQYQDLLIVTVDTLKAVHLLGKTSFNAFSSLKNIKETNDITKEEIELNPSYGFKKNLIRLIGNLCSECKKNQDLVRSMDGIPLLLDCCNLDSRNPFIMQWCILAIRNLLENNPQNQAVVSSISITEELVNSKLLYELGLEVELNNGRPVLKKASHVI